MDLQSLVLHTSEFEFSALAAGNRQNPLVLCLHGFPQFADAWTPILKNLAAAGYYAVAVDQRGYSTTARPHGVGAYDMEELCEDAFQFADALGHSKFHLVGHDWGGLIAWNMAAQQPERLLSLNVISTPHPDAFREALRSDGDQKKKSSYIGLIRLPFHIAEFVFKFQNGRRLRQAYRGKVAAASIEKNLQRLSEPGALTAALNWYRALSFGRSTGPIHVPTLFVWGSKDQALGRTAAEATAKFVRGFYLFKVFREGSHWLLDEEPLAVSELLLQNFLQHDVAAKVDAGMDTDAGSSDGKFKTLSGNHN